MSRVLRNVPVSDFPIPEEYRNQPAPTPIPAPEQLKDNNAAANPVQPKPRDRGRKKGD
jgi:hypothetical protein